MSINSKFRADNRSSFYVMISLVIIIIIGRILTLKTNELSWDVLGYYIHLPALFIYNDYGLNDIGWIHTLLDKYQFTGTLYQLSSGPEGNPIFFFLMGMAILYSPWFFIGHFLALVLGYPTDGFSLPYQYSLAMGQVTYTIIGLVILRKILLHFFNESIAIILLIIVVLGTNYFHFVTAKNLETANILFMFVALVTWYTIRWHENFKRAYLIAISVCVVFIALCKPSEVLVIFIPLLWGVYNKQTFNHKIGLIKRYKAHFLIALGAGILLALPQMLYWYKETGTFLYDSYKNPGVGLDITSPHIAEVLFSFKKGWLLYTPVMIFSIIGFFVLYRRNKGVFVPLLVYSLIAFYIIASWTEWWYGASFSIRPMITLYPLLAITMGFFIEFLQKRKFIWQILVGILVVCFVILNLFQIWQLNNYILDPYRTNKNYYLAIFGKTRISEVEKAHLSPDLLSADISKFPGPDNFKHKNIGCYTFEEYKGNLASQIESDSIKGSVLRMDKNLSFSPEISISYNSLTDKDYVWIIAEVDLLIPEGYNEELPLMVMTFDRKEGSYYYHSYGMDTSINKPGSWGKIHAEFMTSNVRSIHDKLKIYVWHRGQSPVYIDNLKADVFEPYY